MLCGLQSVLRGIKMTALALFLFVLEFWKPFICKDWETFMKYVSLGVVFVYSLWLGLPWDLIYSFYSFPSSHPSIIDELSSFTSINGRWDPFSILFSIMISIFMLLYKVIYQVVSRLWKSSLSPGRFCIIILMVASIISFKSSSPGPIFYTVYVPLNRVKVKITVWQLPSPSRSPSLSQ